MEDFDTDLKEHCRKLVYRADGRMRAKYARAMEALPARSMGLAPVYVDMGILGLVDAQMTMMGWVLRKKDSHEKARTA